MLCSRTLHNHTESVTMKNIAAGIVLGLTLLTSDNLFAQDFGAFEYRNIGPSRGGRVTAVAGTVASPSTFYLGASGGGVWKTEDYGTTWNVVSDGYFETPSIGDIDVAQNDANIVYVGTGSDGLRSNVIVGKGMYKSIDGGESWDHIGLRETGHIGAVEIDPTDHNIVWVAAIGQAFNANEERGVYKTADGGKTWNRVLYVSDTVGFSDIELLPGNPNIVFATAWKAERKPWTIISGGSQEEGGLYKSVDAGLTWEKITTGLPQGLIGKIDLAISRANSSIVYALVEAPDDEGGLYKSIDQGRSFEQVSSESSIRSRPFYYANIDVDPTNPDIVYGMATRNMKSVDGGKTWERLRVPHGDNHDMWINPENPDLFIHGNDGGANVTHNGGKTWSTQFNQPTAELYQVEVDDQYPYWLYAGQQDNSTTIAVPSMPPFRTQNTAAWLIDTGGCETGPGVPKPGNHNIVYSQAGKITMTTGAVSRGGVYTRYPSERSTMTGLAGYLNYRFKTNDSVFSLTGGLRYSNVRLFALYDEADLALIQWPDNYINGGISTNNSDLTWGTGITINTKDKWQLRVLGSTAFRSPNIDDFAKIRVNGKFAVLPNTNLAPEHSFNGEVTLAKQFGRMNNKRGTTLKLSATGFYTYITDVIVRKLGETPTGDSCIVVDGECFTVQQNFNEQNAFIYGASGNLEFKINNNWTFKSGINYTKGRTEFTYEPEDKSFPTIDTLVPLAHIPPLYGQSSLSYQNDRFRIEGVVRFTAKKPVEEYAITGAEYNDDGQVFYDRGGSSDNLEFTPFVRDANNQPIFVGSLGWTTFNIYSSFKFNDKFSIDVALENITDVHYIPFSSGLSAAGRNYIVTLRATF